MLGALPSTVLSPHVELTHSTAALKGQQGTGAGMGNQGMTGQPQGNTGMATTGGTGGGQHGVSGDPLLHNMGMLLLVSADVNLSTHVYSSRCSSPTVKLMSRLVKLRHLQCIGCVAADHSPSAVLQAHTRPTGTRMTSTRRASTAAPEPIAVPLPRPLLIDTSASLPCLPHAHVLTNCQQFCFMNNLVTLISNFWGRHCQGEVSNLN